MFVIAPWFRTFHFSIYVCIKKGFFAKWTFQVLFDNTISWEWPIFFKGLSQTLQTTSDNGLDPSSNENQNTIPKGEGGNFNLDYGILDFVGAKIFHPKCVIFLIFERGILIPTNFGYFCHKNGNFSLFQKNS